MNFFEIEKTLKIKFKNKKILKQILIHKSLDKDYNNEKLEFLGDRVLGLIISKHLLDTFPQDKEGVLDKKFASLVNKKKCLQIANKIGLNRFIQVGNQMNNKENKIQPKILSDCCEALIGGIYLDQGIKTTEAFGLKHRNFDFKRDFSKIIDSKTKLQEFSLKKFKKLPIYKLFNNSGPKHKPQFLVGVKLIDTEYFKSEGYSKKDAEQKAAYKLLNKVL